jgi:hypothetical protein
VTRVIGPTGELAVERAALLMAEDAPSSDEFDPDVRARRLPFAWHVTLWGLAACHWPSSWRLRGRTASKHVSCDHGGPNLTRSSCAWVCHAVAFQNSFKSDLAHYSRSR